MLTSNLLSMGNNIHVYYGFHLKDTMRDISMKAQPHPPYSPELAR